MASPEEIALKYMSPRAQELDRLERYVTCHQYDGRVDWFDTGSEIPLFERKPCINYPIAKSAISSHTDFVLGEGRWPTLTSATSEDDKEIDDEWGLSEDDSDKLDRFVNVVLTRYARLREVAREMLAASMGSRSVAVVVTVQRGRIMAETVRAAWCIPTLDEIGECIKLEIRYPYIETYYDDNKRSWEKRCMLYRRVIDDKTDTVYQPAKAREDGREPEWSVDKAKTKEHGLGFCPVRWYAFLKPCTTADNVDGVAVHEHQLGEIDCLNITLSQKQRAAVTSGDPQAFETGVAEDYNPAPMGNASRGVVDVRAAGPGGKPIGVFATAGGSQASRRRMARKRGAGVIWRYTDKDSKVGYLTIPGDALKAVDDHAKDLRGKIAEALNAIFVDPSEMKTHAAMSGKALSFIFSKQLSFCDGVRQDFGDKALLPLVSMILRIIYVIGSAKPGSIYIPGVKKILPILAKFERDAANDNGEETGTKVWMPPRLEPVWGPYFAPNEQDQLAVVQLVVQALDGGTITTEMAVQKLVSSGVFEAGSAQEIVEAIVEERKQKQAEAVETMAAQHKVTNGDDGGADERGDEEAAA